MARLYNYSTVAQIRSTATKVTIAIMADADIQTWIDAADDYIDSALYDYYTVPFSTTPLTINTISKLLATYYVLRIVYSACSTEQGIWMKSFETQANGLLDKLVKGTMPLIDSTGTSISHSVGAGMRSSTTDYKPVFNAGDIDNMEISEKRIEDENSRYGS